MSISLNNQLSSVVSKMNASNASASSAEKLGSRLSNLENASDEELMEACKSFETYMIEQTLKQVQDSMVPKDEDEENEYLRMFKDRLYGSYAETIADRGDLGIAQKFFEAMKRDYGSKKDA